MKSVNETPAEFGHVKPHPPDPILSLVGRFLSDKNP
jgi:hypothetical protein